MLLGGMVGTVDELQCRKRVNKGVNIEGANPP
jgi:hypothetical protein